MRGGGRDKLDEMHQMKLNEANNAIHSGMGCIAYIFGPHTAHCNGLREDNNASVG